MRCCVAVGAGASIAVIGMSCRFPGGADTPEGYWRLLDAGRHVSTGLPQDRGWNVSRLYDPDPAVEGTTYVRQGGFLTDVGGFDAAFFGIAPREAAAMDPQQRLLLECGWHALEDARVAPYSLAGSPTGVYVGVTDSGYLGGYSPKDVSGAEGHLATGRPLSAVAGRLSYALGLNGAAMSVDTACSSSLVATHLAMQALRAGECEMALAAGVCVLAGPDELVYLSRLEAMAPDGMSKAFAAGANGFAPAEGVGVLVMMPLGRALAEKRRVLAVLRGSAVNEDGASGGFSAPSGRAQQAVMSAALKDASLLPEQVELVEGHGTGTKVGDPIEADSVQAVYAAARRGPREPVWLGSVKSNIGHTQAAAGIAGLIKVILALQHERMPATLHIDDPHPQVDWSASLRLLREPRAWPRGEQPRRAGVLAYGISGTNAHVLVEEAPEPLAPRPLVPELPQPGPRAHLRRPGPSLWPVYAASDAGLRDQAAALGQWVRQHPDADAADVGWSLATTRSPLRERAVVMGEEPAQMLAALDALAAQPDGCTDVPPRAARGRTVADGAGPVFVFPGQGAQWAGMGARLLDQSPLFTDAFERCAQALGPWVDFDVTVAVRGEPGAPPLVRADVVQPALFAVYVALAELWQAHGVRPAAVIGHSQGEIAAAYVAGALSLEDAARVVARRSVALRGLRDMGAMAVIGLPAERTRALLERWSGQGRAGQVGVAAENGPSATTVAGDVAAVREVLDYCERQEVWARLLPVDYASHCPQVEAVRTEILRELADVVSQPSAVPMLSTTTGRMIGAGELDADYWYRSLREPVRFEPAVRKLISLGHRKFLEVSPCPVLNGPVREILADARTEGAVFATLNRDRGDLEDFIQALAAAHAHGVEVDWSVLYPDARTVDLPTYRFQRRHHWLPSAPDSLDLGAAGLSDARHPLLGAVTDLPDGCVVSTGRLSLEHHPWLAGHAVHGTVLLPATGMTELLTHAAEHTGSASLRDIVFQAPLVLGEKPVDIQVHCSAPTVDGSRQVTLSSRAHRGATAWTRHAEATAGSTLSGSPPALSDVVWPPADAEPLDISECYTALDARGYQYGPAFRGLASAWRSGQILHAEVRLPRGTDTGDFTLHPALLDAVLHALVLEHADGATLLPYAIGSLQVHQPGVRVLRATLTPLAAGRFRVVAVDEAGEPAVIIEDLRLRPIQHRRLRALVAAADGVAYRPVWRPVPLPEVPSPRLLDWAAVTTADDLPGARIHPDTAELRTTPPSPGQAPQVVVLDCRHPRTADPDDVLSLASATRARLTGLLEHLLAVLDGDHPAGTRLLVLTRHAQSTAFAEAVEDLPAAACAGMARSAGNEYPGRIQVLDTGHETPDAATLSAVVASGRPVVALRDGEALVPRLAVAHDDEALHVPYDGSPWKLVASPQHTLEGIRPAPAPELAEPVGPGRVRVRVAATGLNFRDSVFALGMIGGTPLGGEISGTVEQTGQAVTGWQVGDRVMLCVTAGNGYAPVVDVPAEDLCSVPANVPLVLAAGVPVVTGTAYHGLVAIGQLKAGEKVLVHAAAGGVGMAAIRLAQRIGAEVHATASPLKHALVRALGIPHERLADSRTLDFEQRLLRATGGSGFDVVMGSLAGDFVDASLRLLRPGGRYLEMGKTDRRDPRDVRAGYPGITYAHFDLTELPPSERLAGLQEHAVPAPLPTQTWNVRYARQAIRHMSQGRSTGKIVLTQPAGLDPNGTVLITGGTGTLGALLARHLVAVHGARHLLLLSRQGEHSPGAGELVQDLESRGASVTVTACDASDGAALGAVLKAVPTKHPLSAVIHAAGALDDALLADLTPARVESVLRSKADAVLNLHRLTKDSELSTFVMYSSMAALLGTPGQANYAAANAFLDAFAHYRRHQGLPAISLGWGLWQETSSLTSGLDRNDRTRLARLGLTPLSSREALAAFDAALELDLPHLAVTSLSPDIDKSSSSDLLADLTGRQHRRPRHAPSTDEQAPRYELAQLLTLPAGERPAALIALVRAHAAAVLGHRSPDDIGAEQPFRKAGLDSLGSVELRTRLARVLDTQLAATVLMDHPSPKALAEHVDSLLTTTPGTDPVAVGDPLVSAFVEHTRSGDHERALQLVGQAALQRPVATSAALLTVPAWEQISTGGPGPRVLCLPPLPSPPGAAPYAALAAALGGRAETWTAELPGYQPGPLPADLRTALAALAAGLPFPEDGRPYVLLGHSSGGTLAHALAAMLHSRPPAGLILLDAPARTRLTGPLREEISRRLARMESLLTHAALTAIRTYSQFLEDAEPGDLGIPVLHVHPRGSGFPQAWSAGTAELCPTGGDHHSMLEAHAPEVAQHVHRWLSR
ncbi:SDR family NAD(P)-dependent oxidoreductase [Streptomyces tauricus]